MGIAAYIILGLGTAIIQFNRSIRAGLYPQRAILDALIAGFLFVFAWIAWAVRGKPQ